MKHIKKTLSAVIAAGLLLSLRAGACAVGRTYVDNTTPESGKGGTLVLVLAIAVMLFAAMAWIVKQGKSGRLNVPWAVLSVLLSGAALFLCLIGSSSGTLYTKAEGNPADTVRAFYEGIVNRDFAAAYACLSDYAGLGLENAPESENARLAYEALLSSFDYSLTGEQKIQGLEAEVEVRFRYLNLPSFEGSVAKRTTERLKELVDALPVNEVYDENDRYLPSVTERAYAESLAFVLDKADTYYDSQLLVVKLKYIEGSWLILTDDAMLSPLTGGTAHG